ncbi:hypothetical protein ID866_5603 [Astraeus odoratus]|nr:hypothetical protein ID866_5603 [Astraeus odoratus]
MNKLAVTDIHANVPAVRSRLEEDQISRLQTVLRYLYTAMDLLARRARQIKMRRIAEQMLHKRGAIHSAVCGAAPLIGRLHRRFRKCAIGGDHRCGQLKTQCGKRSKT